MKSRAFLEELALPPRPAPDRGGALQIAPFPKTVFVLAYLILLVSIRRYDWLRALLFAAFPCVLARAGGLSIGFFLRRTLAALPFVVCAGLANLFFDRAPQPFLPGLSAPGGVLSFLVLAEKTLGSVFMVLLLSTTTPMQGLAGALTRLHVPCLLVVQIQLLFRYLFVLADEARTRVQAYQLRNPGVRAIPLRDWGGIVGRLFLRSVGRANGVYRAMACRLYRADAPLPTGDAGTAREWTGVFILFLGLCLLRFWP